MKFLQKYNEGYGGNIILNQLRSNDRFLTIEELEEIKALVEKMLTTEGREKESETNAIKNSRYDRRLKIAIRSMDLESFKEILAEENIEPKYSTENFLGTIAFFADNSEIEDSIKTQIISELEKKAGTSLSKYL